SRVAVRYTTASIGSALSVIATRPPGGIVGVAPELASTWLGLWIPELRYLISRSMCGRPVRSALRRYMRLSETMDTASRPTANGSRSPRRSAEPECRGSCYLGFKLTGLHC